MSLPLKTQFIGFSPDVDLSERKSASTNDMVTPVTLGEILSYTYPINDGNDNLIVADNSNLTVSVGNGESHLIDNFSGMLIVNDYYAGGVELWIAGGGDGIMVSHTTAAPGNSTLTLSSNGYEWTNVDGLTGPFTFTVIITRPGS